MVVLSWFLRFLGVESCVVTRVLCAVSTDGVSAGRWAGKRDFTKDGFHAAGSVNVSDQVGGSCGVG